MSQSIRQVGCVLRLLFDSISFCLWVDIGQRHSTTLNNMLLLNDPFNYESDDSHWKIVLNLYLFMLCY